MSDEAEEIKALEARIDELESAVRTAREDIIVLGKWLKVLAENDLLVMNFTLNTFHPTPTDKTRDKAREIAEFLFKFREDIRESIVTDPPEEPNGG